MTAGLLIFAIVMLGLWLYRRIVSPRPEFPALETRPDDPLLLEAEARARASLDTFISLVQAPHGGALVKLGVVSSTEQVEHLWAEVVELRSDGELEVRLVTPPVTHSGRLERLHICTLDDVEDWHVLDADGRVHGGFTQRAMYAIARRDGIALPKKLLEQQKLYVNE
jgi:uncharacterized protein YegJ (DUF2314 family)